MPVEKLLFHVKVLLLSTPFSFIVWYCVVKHNFIGYPPFKGDPSRMTKSLYHWQQECIKQWFDNNSRGVVKVVTGAGKSYMALNAARELKAKVNGNLRVKIVVPKMFMVSQWTNFIMEAYKEDGITRDDIGCYYGLHKDNPDRPFMIYVINSARYALARHVLLDYKDEVGVLIIADECHHCASVENKKMFDFLPELSEDDKKNYFSLGLSATPHTHGFLETIVPSLGPLIYTYGFSEAIGQHIINNCVLYHVGLRFSAAETALYEELTAKIAKLLGVSRKYIPSSLKVHSREFFIAIRKLASGKDIGASKWAIGLLGFLYKRRALVHEASVRIECAQVLISRLDPASKIIVFGERISQSDLLYDDLVKMYPNQVARYHSKMGEEAKKQAISRFRDKEARILVCCKALDEGFNIPSADVGIVLSSTSTERQRIQRLGRILRSSDSKALSNLYYFFVSDTVEEEVLLKESVPEMKEFTLHYYNGEENFQHDVYDELAYSVVENLKAKGQDESTINIVRYFLELGQLKSDWLLEVKDIQQKVNQSTEKVSHNYWVSMLHMAKMRLR